MNWIRAQTWRLRMLARDGRRLLGGILRTAVWAVRPPLPRAALALLAGEPLARAGLPAAYQVRVYNAGPDRLRLEVSVRGWGVESEDRRFDIRWEAVLDPDAAAEWWVRSSWRGDAELLAERPIDVPIHWRAEPDGRWTIEAEIYDHGEPRPDRLVIGGTFTS
jgi:hypothetical protein